MGAVLADVRAHEPAQAVVGLLLDERHVAPRVRAELARVVVGVPGEREAVLGHEVPLLARHLARLAADADRRVGEEARPRLDLQAVGRLPVSLLHRPTPPRSLDTTRRARAALARAGGARAGCRSSPP